MSSAVWSFGPLGELSCSSTASAHNVALGRSSSQPSNPAITKIGNNEVTDIENEKQPTGKVVKGRWSAEEDEKLRALVVEHGAQKWKEIAKLHGTRDFKQCRDRWRQYLDPMLVRTAFTPEDDERILKAIDEGKKWSSIAFLLPGRSPNDIKNYWHSHLKKKRKGAPENLEQLMPKTKRLPSTTAPTAAVPQPARHNDAPIAPLFTQTTVLSHISVISASAPTASADSAVPSPPTTMQFIDDIFKSLKPDASPIQAPLQVERAVGPAVGIEPLNLGERFEQTASLPHGNQHADLMNGSFMSIFFCDEELEEAHVLPATIESSFIL